MKILVVGSDGMLGHVVKQYFEDNHYEVFGTSRRNRGDFYFDANKDIHQIDSIVEKVKPDVVINCIGILNRTAEEHQSMAVMINSYLPHYLDELSEQFNFKFIHVSTDCVFDGKKGQYSESSLRDATSFYGRSKALGEIENDRSLTIRTSIVGPDPNENGIGLFKWFMEQENEVRGFHKVLWSGVTTIQLAHCIGQAISYQLTGLYHAVNGEFIDKYSLLCLFKKYFDKKIDIIVDDSYVSDKTLITEKTDFKFQIPSYESMIEEMRTWVNEHENLYPQLVKKINRK